MFGSRNGSFEGSVVGGCVEPPGTLPAGGVGLGAAPGVVVCGMVDGGALGLVCCVPGGAGGFVVGFVTPGITGCPGGREGSFGAGVGRGVEVGTCAQAALTPANTTDARTTGLINFVDIELNIERRAP